MRVDDILSNPTLRYRLDPGEPGLLRSATAKDSTRAVTSQEQRNLNRLRSQAAVQGRVVISSHISYTRAIAGSFSAVQAGLTTVTTVPAEEHLKTLTEQKIPTNDEEPIATNAPPDENNSTANQGQALKAAANPTTTNQAELQKQELELQARLAALKRLEQTAQPTGGNIPAAGTNNPTAPVNKVTDETGEGTASAEVRTQTQTTQATIGTGKNPEGIRREIELVNQQLSKIRTERIIQELSGGQTSTATAPSGQSSLGSVLNMLV